LDINSTLATKEIKVLPLAGSQVRSGDPWALICQFLLAAERVHLPKSEFFSAMTHPKTSLAEFSHPLD
jgi:hypothetical protein